MKAGRVVAEGPPEEIVTAELVRDVFGLSSVVVPDPVTGSPLVVPVPPEARALVWGGPARAGARAQVRAAPRGKAQCPRGRQR
ncbi:hypothetical protein STANM309S_04292 [Streptomyces tanashiensis]